MITSQTILSLITGEVLDVGDVIKTISVCCILSSSQVIRH